MNNRRSIFFVIGSIAILFILLEAVNIISLRSKVFLSPEQMKAAQDYWDRTTLNCNGYRYGTGQFGSIVRYQDFDFTISEVPLTADDRKMGYQWIIVTVPKGRNLEQWNIYAKSFQRQPDQTIPGGSQIEKQNGRLSYYGSNPVNYHPPRVSCPTI